MSNIQYHLLKNSGFLIVLTCCFFNVVAYSQVEVEAWGNLKGIRTDGQLMQVESSIDVVNTGWSKIASTGKERQRPKYKREQDTQIVTTRIDSFYFVLQTEDIGKGTAKINVQFTSKKDTAIEGLFFHLKLPYDDYKSSIIELEKPQQKALAKYKITELETDLSVTASAVKFNSAQRQLAVIFENPANLIIKKNSSNNYIDVFIPLKMGAAKAGETGAQNFTLRATGTIDKAPVTLQLNTADTGNMFAGFGGNFRLQNPKTDPQVIDYCLDSMRVAWGRVEMPWQLWQPVKASDPIEMANAGKLNDHVKKSMEMAQRLNKMGIPVILTAWSAPRWAISGDISYGPRSNGVWGNPLDTSNTQEIYKSIGDYITYLRDVYGVEVKLFSFNESDLGINIRQTGEEHAALIKGLGAYFLAHGLKTKMLLGDNSDATTYNFIYPAMKDTATYPYIGAVSFHSWRGWDTDILQKWADAAKQMKLPLIVGEGSIDAAAWNYPLIFEEQTYALEEINLYVRLLAICQPLTILQWQLTADYSPLSGGGIFGNNEPLRPTQRFWNLKQLASIPPNLLAMPVTVDRPYISCAAEGNNEKGVYAIHLVNNGATRTVTLKGLPKTVKQLNIFVTNKAENMQEQKPVKVVKSQAKFELAAVSYVTLVTAKAN